MAVIGVATVILVETIAQMPKVVVYGGHKDMVGAVCFVDKSMIREHACETYNHGSVPCAEDAIRGTIFRVVISKLQLYDLDEMSSGRIDSNKSKQTLTPSQTPG